MIVQLADLGVPGEAYNMASQKTVRMSDLLDIILSLSTRKDIKIEKDPSRLRAYDEKVHASSLYTRSCSCMSASLHCVVGS